MIQVMVTLAFSCTFAVVTYLVTSNRPSSRNPPVFCRPPLLILDSGRSSRFHFLLGAVHTNPGILKTAYFVTRIGMHGFLSHSRERFENQTGLVSEFTGFVWTEGAIGTINK